MTMTTMTRKPPYTVLEHGKGVCVLSWACFHPPVYKQASYCKATLSDWQKRSSVK